MRRSMIACVATLMMCVFSGVSWAGEDEKEIELGRWYHEASLGLNLTQSAFSSNWQGGENGSLSWTAVFNGTAQRRYENGVDWISRVQLRFGQLHQQRKGESGNRVWARPEKSEDKIDLETVIVVAKGWSVDPYVSARWESQFLDVSDPFNRDLIINPNSFKESAGLAHRFLDGEEEMVLMRLGLTVRQNTRRTFVDDTGNSDETESNLSFDGGLEFQADWKLKIVRKKVAWVLKLSAYQPLAWSKAKDFDGVSADSLAADGIDVDVKDFTTQFEIGWENTFTVQVAKLITLNLYVEFVYDKYDNSVVPKTENGRLVNAADVGRAIRKAGQYKQTLAVGLTYSF